MIKEGDWLALPLTEGGYVLVLAARASRSYPTVLAYVFGPRRETKPTMADTAHLTAQKALYVAPVSLSLTGEVIGSHASWNRSQWPMPKFSSKEQGAVWIVTRDENDLGTILSREPSTEEAVRDLPRNQILDDKTLPLRIDLLLLQQASTSAAPSAPPPPSAALPPAAPPPAPPPVAPSPTAPPAPAPSAAPSAPPSEPDVPAFDLDAEWYDDSDDAEEQVAAEMPAPTPARAQAPAVVAQAPASPPPAPIWPDADTQRRGVPARPSAEPAKETSPKVPDGLFGSSTGRRLNPARATRNARAAGIQEDMYWLEVAQTPPSTTIYLGTLREGRVRFTEILRLGGSDWSDQHLWEVLAIRGRLEADGFQEGRRAHARDLRRLLGLEGGE